jgi:hypothetical protein
MGLRARRFRVGTLELKIGTPGARNCMAPCISSLKATRCVDFSNTVDGFSVCWAGTVLPPKRGTVSRCCNMAEENPNGDYLNEGEERQGGNLAIT